MQEFINVNDTVRPEGDWETIQAAIELSCKKGFRTVKIPRYNKRTGEAKWSLSHAIQLPGDFTLLLDNCTLEQAKGSYENLIVNEHMYEEGWLRDPSHRTKNIKIIGEGHVVLSGGEHNHLLEKTQKKYHLPETMYYQNLLCFANVDGLEVQNLHLKDQRWWAIVHVCVAHASYKNIHFEAIPHVPNMDGLDLRIGCHDFSLENITGRTGDDVLAFTGLYGGENRFFVTGESRDIHNVKIRNLKAASHNCNLIRLLNHDNCREYNFDIDTVMDSSDCNSFQPRLGIGIGSPFYFHETPAQPGDTSHVTVKNFYTRAISAIRLSQVCSDSHFTNIHSFGQCENLFDTVSDGLTLSNIKMENLYFGTTQPVYPNGETVEREKYRGYLVNLPNTTGDISIKGIEADPVGTGFRVSGHADLTVHNVKGEDIVHLTECDDTSHVTIS